MGAGEGWGDQENAKEVFVSRIIDRRLNGKNKSAVNRQRFIGRYKTQIKRAISDAITGRSIQDIESSEKVSIPAKDINEPSFNFGKGGVWEAVHPGNHDFIKGDKIDRPQGEGGGTGSQASDQGEGVDDFVFQISKDEFLDLFFDDLALPNLSKKQISQTATTYKWVRAGFMRDGTPNNLNIIRSLRGALGRRIAQSADYRVELKDSEEKLQDLLKHHSQLDPIVVELKEKITELKRKIGLIPWLDPFDLRFNNRIKQPEPSSRAVMFCVMDVSGSMDQSRKDIAKRFFILLYLFLSRNYKKTDVVFIRHHTTAKEVDEQEFFYSQETGGTVVSSALKLALQIIEERYPRDQWNIYVAQASDGDNWGNDSPLCKQLLTEKIMPLVQYFAYIEITSSFHQSLWREYTAVKEEFKHFAMQHIEGPGDIYPVFRQLFKRQAA